MMNKNINLSEKGASSLKKAIGWGSLSFISAMILALALGFIPIFQQSSNIWKMFLGVLEIFSIRTKPLVYCLFRCGFSAAYFLVLVFAVKSLIKAIPNIKHWKDSEHDTNVARSAIKLCVNLQNEIFLAFVVLMVLSHMLNSYRLGLWSILIFSVFVLVNLALNCAILLLLKREWHESVLSSLSTTLVLVVTLLFVFNVKSVDADILIKQAFAFLKALFYVSYHRLFQSVFNLFLVPSFTIYVTIKLLLLFKKSLNYGITSWKSKQFMLTTVIGFAVIALMQIISCDSFSLWVLWSLVINNLEFALVGLAVYFLSKNQGTKCPDIPSYDDIIKAEMEAQARELEALETEEIIETTETTETVDASIE